ncbi:MAG: hypothetical protein R2733_10420 [Acidimicrobiales bacterium]
MKSRRLLALASTALTAATVLPAVPASAQWNSQPSIVGSNKVNVMKGGESWVSVNWTAPSDMENFRVIVNEWTNGVEIEYAADRTSAALTNDANLSAGEIDSTAFLLKVDENASSSFFLQLVAEWEHNGETFRFYPGGLDVRAEKFDGDRFSVLTDSATVKAGPAGTADPKGNWVEIDLLGLAPVTDGIKIELETDLEPYYPQETFTSLHHDDRLHAQESDVARIWFDPELVEPGTYEIEMSVTWIDSNPNGKNPKTKTETFPFTLTVES